MQAAARSDSCNHGSQVAQLEKQRTDKTLRQRLIAVQANLRKQVKGASPAETKILVIGGSSSRKRTNLMDHLWTTSRFPLRSRCVELNELVTLVKV